MKNEKYDESKKLITASLRTRKWIKQTKNSVESIDPTIKMEYHKYYATMKKKGIQNNHTMLKSIYSITLSSFKIKSLILVAEEIITMYNRSTLLPIHSFSELKRKGIHLLENLK